MAGLAANIGETFSGRPGSSSILSNLPQFADVNPNTYQIQGYDDYLKQLSGLESQVPTADWGQAEQSREQQAQLMQQYLAMANGTGPSAAQSMLQRSTQQGMAQQQALALGNQAGVNPALAMRNVAHGQAAMQSRLASEGATLRSQEQMTGQKMAGDYATAMRQQAIQQERARYDAQMLSLQAREEIASRRFSAGAQQTALNVRREERWADNKKFWDMWQYQQQQTASANDAANSASTARAIGTGAGTVIGGVVGGVAGFYAGGVGAVPGALGGAAVGGAAGNAIGGLFGGGGGGGGGIDPQLTAMMAERYGSKQPFTYDDGRTGTDINMAESYGTYADPALQSTAPTQISADYGYA